MKFLLITTSFYTYLCKDMRNISSVIRADVSSKRIQLLKLQAGEPP